MIAAAAGGAISAALVLIPAYEGVEYRPYRDVAGVLTVCYGHTGSDIQAGKIYTADECGHYCTVIWIKSAARLIR